ncbi:hypothetical protein PV760_15995 [Paenarthrobacter sp. CC6]|uniref:hypothetical protein n=1 Tax=Paenarthrobacter TaxID=1742992 RepID=UPI0009D2164E|nr:hypothetical protein [Paenarthrobacter nicotinovorans]MDI2022231.1 hypothetical protein [Paenarthrobacter nicotinovorans]SKB90293.1 hypothetical protein SAMN05660916_03245 [Arthrobacter sp. 31Cvi3.1E]
MNASQLPARPSGFRSFYSSLSGLFPSFAKDLVPPVITVVAGGLFASLFTWKPVTDGTALTANEIFAHNFSLALVALLLTQYGARIMMLANGFYLGMGLVGSVASAGLAQTVALTLVHVPLEIVAWVMTIQGARLFWPTLVAVLRKEGIRTKFLPAIMRTIAAFTVFYVLAAVAEWAEYALLKR